MTTFILGLLLTLSGIALNMVGSVCIYKTPFEVAFGGPARPARRTLWKVGWALMLIGYGLQIVGVIVQAKRNV